MTELEKAQLIVEFIVDFTDIDELVTRVSADRLKQELKDGLQEGFENWDEYSVRMATQQAQWDQETIELHQRLGLDPERFI